MNNSDLVVRLSFDSPLNPISYSSNTSLIAAERLNSNFEKSVGFVGAGLDCSQNRAAYRLTGVNVPNGTEPFTLCFWMRHFSKIVGDDKYPVAVHNIKWQLRGEAYVRGGMEILIVGEPRQLILNLFLWQNGTDGVVGLQMDANDDGEWHHYAAVRSVDGATQTVQVFKDGEARTQLTFRDGTFFHQGDLIVGQNPESNLGGFNGMIDEFALYSRALAASEISEIFEFEEEQSRVVQTTTRRTEESFALFTTSGASFSTSQQQEEQETVSSRAKQISESSFPLEELAIVGGSALLCLLCILIACVLLRSRRKPEKQDLRETARSENLTQMSVLFEAHTDDEPTMIAADNAIISQQSANTSVYENFPRQPDYLVGEFSG